MDFSRLCNNKLISSLKINLFFVNWPPSLLNQLLFYGLSREVWNYYLKLSKQANFCLGLSTVFDLFILLKELYLSPPQREAGAILVMPGVRPSINLSCKRLSRFIQLVTKKLFYFIQTVLVLYACPSFRPFKLNIFVTGFSKTSDKINTRHKRIIFNTN